ncbi:TPA: DpnII family type II restriction endonuclease, partial [Streptococcus suis]
NHKKFDFAIHVNGQLYLTEVNFYSKSGSKPNETTRSYENLAEKLTEISNVHFVWITDGEGWQRSKSNLEEAFERIPRLYNLHDIRNKNIKELLEMEMD